MINYDTTLKIPQVDAVRATSAPLTLPDPTTPVQPKQSTSAPSQAQIDPLLCQEAIFWTRWWLFVALLVWTILPIGIALIYKYH